MRTSDTDLGTQRALLRPTPVPSLPGLGIVIAVAAEAQVERRGDGPQLGDPVRPEVMGNQKKQFTSLKMHN